MSTAPVAQAATGAGLRWMEGLRYGLLGLPLAFVALPLYVLLPNYYARGFGVPLATLGAVLLGTRLFDAVIDPLLGRWSDRLYSRSTRAVLAWAAGAALALAAVVGAAASTGACDAAVRGSGAALAPSLTCSFTGASFLGAGR